MTKTVTEGQLLLPRRGPGGEPVDLWRTFLSHGVTSLPPMHVDEDAKTFEITLHAGRGRPRTVVVAANGQSAGRVRVVGTALSIRGATALMDALGHVLRLDEDLSDFYALAAGDPLLSWATTGAGRMVRSPTVFEEVVKTVCTTNCAWSATERMVGALVAELGEAAPGAPKTGPRGRAFPAPEAMAEVGEDFYREVARAGYRGAYLQALARGVAEGSLDLEMLAGNAPEDLPDDEVEARLLALPGVGPYAAAHIMMMIGRYHRLILDSWTRPKYARLTGRKASDQTIARRFKRYGPYAGLAFWLFVTQDWV